MAQDPKAIGVALRLRLGKGGEERLLALGLGLALAHIMMNLDHKANP